MFDTQSRYVRLETATMTLPDGRVAAFVRRRFLQQSASMPLLQETRVEPGERLDLFTARTLGDPEQFWRVADANTAMRPAALTAEDRLGAVIVIPLPLGS